MPAYLPAYYEPIADGFFRGGADVADMIRRIARNQNWLWANAGAVYAAWGFEPTSFQSPTVVGTASVTVARFAAPCRSRTGSDSVRVVGLINKLGVEACYLRLYQLLPGETEPTANTPYDEGEASIVAGADHAVSFAARIRAGSDPMRFVLMLRGAGTTAEFKLLTASVWWEAATIVNGEELTSGLFGRVLGESLYTWTGRSQSFVAADRAVTPWLLATLSHQTLGLMARDPTPIYAHSFVWPQRSSETTAAGARQGLWLLHNSTALAAMSFTVDVRFLVAGQGAQVRPRIVTYSVPAYVQQSSTTGATTAVPPGDRGAYVDEYEQSITVSATAPSGQLLAVELYLDVITAASVSVGSSVPGAAVLGCTITQDPPTLANLGLPGGEFVPDYYQPLDDLAIAPGRAIVAQNDRLGRRAGPYYLIRNLIWLAAHRTAHTHVADWVHRVVSAGYKPDVGQTKLGDGKYRNGTISKWWNTMDPKQYPGFINNPGWTDRLGATDAQQVPTGHHFEGDVLFRARCRPQTAGKITAILRPSQLYVPGAPEYLGGRAGRVRLNILDWQAPSSQTLFEAGIADAVGGYVSAGPARFGATMNDQTVMTIVGGNGDPGMQIGLEAAYVYAAPLTKADLDALG